MTDSEPESVQPEGVKPASGLDLLTIALLVFFIALIGIVAALLLLPILAS